MEVLAASMRVDLTMCEKATPPPQTRKLLAESVAMQVPYINIYNKQNRSFFHGFAIE